MSEFRNLLKEVLKAQLDEVGLRALSRSIDIDHSHLSKVFDGDRNLSPKAVGRVARLLPSRKGAALIKAYLKEVAAEIAEQQEVPIAGNK